MVRCHNMTNELIDKLDNDIIIGDDDDNNNSNNNQPEIRLF